MADQGNDSGDDDIEILDPNHPAMQRVQAALKRQLQRRMATLNEELAAKAQAASDAKRTREQVGVELYNLQQVLAKLQTQVEAVHDQSDGATEERQKTEEILAQAKKIQTQLREELAAVNKQAESVRLELGEASSKVRTVELHNDELRSQVAVQRRVVSKAAMEQDKKEIVKQQQDLYVDQLQERAKELNTQVAMSRKQKEAQAAQTDSARAALREASAEVEAIAMERRELQQQWAESMAGLARRDEALAALDAAVREQQQLVFGKEREVESLKRDAGLEQERNEVASQQLARVEADLVASKKKLEGLLEKQDATRRQYALLTRTLQETEAQLSRLTMEGNLKSSALRAAREQVDRLARRRLELELAVSTRLQDHATADKAGKGVARAMKEVRARIAQQDGLAAQLENDIARQTVLATDAQTLIEGAREEMGRLLQDQQEQEGVVARYVAETRRNATEMQRKQAMVDQLNRKIDATRQRLAAEGGGNGDISPSDIEIAGLQRSITETAESNAALQQRWLSSQRELVTQEKEKQQLEVEIEDMKTRSTLLQEKKMRVDGECETVRSEIKEVNRSFRVLQSDVVRLNTLITQNKGAQHQLLQDTSVMEADFVRSLRDDELRSIQLQEKLVVLQDEKAHLLTAIAEAERQLLLWEKKIQLAKETKASINAEEGREELELMRAEIHRMQLRLEQVDKCKERLIVEMEMSVDRREHITTKAHNSHKAGKNLAQASVKKEVMDLTRRLKQTTGDAAACESDMASLQDAIGQMDQEIRQAQGEALRAREMEADVQRRMEELTLRRARAAEETVDEQQRAKRLQGMMEGRTRPRLADPAAYEAAMGRALGTLRSVNSICAYVAREHAAAQGPLQRLQTTINGELDRAEGVAAGKQGE